MFKSIQILIFFALPLVFTAQVVEKEMDMSSGSNSGLEVDLPIDSKNAEKIWKNYVKPYGKTNWDRRNKEHVLFDVRISSITSSPLTVVTRFNQFKDMTKGSFWFKVGDSFLDSESDAEALRGAAEFLQEYAYETERFSMRKMVEAQEKVLKGMDKEYGKLQKKNQNLHKDIEKAKELILKKEKEIEENLAAQAAKEKEMEQQKEKIQNTTIELTNIGKSN